YEFYSKSFRPLQGVISLPQSPFIMGKESVKLLFMGKKIFIHNDLFIKSLRVYFIQAFMIVI
ncbi:hypothetical protein ACQP3C_26750, partial [Escherichia coli]